jgi:hypothetical protein
VSRKHGLRFECTQCGECCTTRGEYAYVYVTDDEVLALADLLKLTPAEFRRRHTFVDGDGFRQLAFEGDRCVFLTESGACRVYPARPVQCRTFPFWRGMVRGGQWTREARRLCEGVGQGRLYTIEEVESRIAEYAESQGS